MRATAADSTAAAEVRRIRAPLLRWYARAKRNLPWRLTSDPYAIWISEVMLQQTTVAAVIPYWERFIRRYPTIAALARSSEDDVLALWSGLGYYSRARALRQGAIEIKARHAGRMPSSVAELMLLPGIGRYTAGAIASLAFGRETPVVDGNVRRVLSRLFAIRSTGAAADRAYWDIAGKLVKGARPGDWNQALMELGATVCTPRSPRCAACPVEASCLASARGEQASLPPAAPRPVSRAVPVAIAWIERDGQVFVVRNDSVGPLRGAWDLPATVLEAGETAGGALRRTLRARYGVSISTGANVASARHSILASRLEIQVVAANPRGPFPRRASHRWVAIDEIGGVPVSGATAKIARAIAASAQKRSQVRRSSGSSRPIGREKA